LKGFAAEWDPKVQAPALSGLQPGIRDHEHPPRSEIQNDSVIAVPEMRTSREPLVPSPMSRLEYRALPGQRTIIQVEDIDFVTMHNFLYYLYTGCVNLHQCNEGYEKADGYPEEADAFRLYCAANMYMLESLEDRCCHYLSATCTPENIIERLFENIECAHHDKIRDIYLKYLHENFGLVKNTKQWEEMMLDTENPEELRRHKSKLLLDITKMLSGTK
jgi:hypothetical protein